MYDGVCHEGVTIASEAVARITQEREDAPPNCWQEEGGC
jgi:hypothetical protein